jgi:hypothetical protein
MIQLKKLLIIIMLIAVTIVIILSISNSYKDPGIRETSTKCFVVEKGMNPDRSKYIIVKHVLLSERGNEKIEVESEMVWNLIEENEEYSVTYKIFETKNELAEIRRIPEFD